MRDLPDIDDIRAGIRHHHERWDGSGYLHALAGEDIPLVARILAVGDAFSAMTTTRPYRKALDVREALTRLGDASGSQLDERLVAPFVHGIEHERTHHARARVRSRRALDARPPRCLRAVDALAWRRAGALGLGFALVLAMAGTALAARAWTIEPRPSSLDENATSTVTLDVRNTGGDGGGDEIGCVVVTIPGGFTIESASVSRVKGDLGSRLGRGGQRVEGRVHGAGGLERARRPAVRRGQRGVQDRGHADRGRVHVVDAVAYDKPGSGTSTKCGSGTFPTKTLSFSVAPAPTPRPSPTPTPRPRRLRPRPQRDAHNRPRRRRPRRRPPPSPTPTSPSTTRDTDHRPVRLACPDVQGDGAAQSLANDRTDVLTGTWRSADARPDEPADHAAGARCTIGLAQGWSDRKSRAQPHRGIAHALGGGLLLAGPWRVPISARHRYVERGGDGDARGGGGGAGGGGAGAGTSVPASSGTLTVGSAEDGGGALPSAALQTPPSPRSARSGSAPSPCRVSSSASRGCSYSSRCCSSCWGIRLRADRSTLATGDRLAASSRRSDRSRRLTPARTARACAMARWTPRRVVPRGDWRAGAPTGTVGIRPKDPGCRHVTRTETGPPLVPHWSAWP